MIHGICGPPPPLFESVFCWFRRAAGGGRFRCGADGRATDVGRGGAEFEAHGAGDFGDSLSSARRATDGRNLEFVELYNSNPWTEDLRGWRLSGDIDFVFPAGSQIAAKGISRRRESARRCAGGVWPSSGVLGGFAQDLSNEGGTLRLRKPSGAIVLEVSWNDHAPWPVAPMAPATRWCSRGRAMAKHRRGPGRRARASADRRAQGTHRPPARRIMWRSMKCSRARTNRSSILSSCATTATGAGRPLRLHIERRFRRARRNSSFPPARPSPRGGLISFTETSARLCAERRRRTLYFTTRRRDACARLRALRRLRRECEPRPRP